MEMKGLFEARVNPNGEINLQWDSYENAVSYIVEFSVLRRSKNTRLEILDIISDSCYTVRNLKSNKIYLFRISIIDKNGQTLSFAEIAEKAS